MLIHVIHSNLGFFRFRFPKGYEWHHIYCAHPGVVALMVPHVNVLGCHANELYARSHNFIMRSDIG